MTAKELSKGNPILPANPSVFNNLEEARKRKVEDCQLLKYQPTYSESETWAISMHQLTYKFKERCHLIKKVEEETREQSNSALWFELRYGRITASRAFEVSRCKTSDGTLISLILGGKIPDTPAMKRGRVLENEVRKTVESKIKKKS
ncbi:hypothetical protein SFRURICE_021596 [Spodoptera frugiperda]|nr:hypothetical protein SFRURICE_021596 [Spodoptera frugiperda]